MATDKQQDAINTVSPIGRIHLYDSVADVSDFIRVNGSTLLTIMSLSNDPRPNAFLGSLFHAAAAR
jgi:hypothetical protein